MERLSGKWRKDIENVRQPRVAIPKTSIATTS
jgi:hypothetical protein